MKNTEQLSVYKEIELFGKTIAVKNYICAKDGGQYRQKPENVKLQLTINPSSYCSMACPFCIAGDTKKKDMLDKKKLERALVELKNADIVRGISMTGGEPFTDVGLLNEIVNMIFDILGEETEISITTNGSNIEKIASIEKLHKIDALHISRHHYDDDINASLFGGNVPSTKVLRGALENIAYRDLLIFNCLLMKDYIGSKEEVHKFLDYANSLEFSKVAFITPTAINDFTREQRVEFESVIKADDEAMLFTRGYRDYEYCHCQDGIYMGKNGRLIEFYGRTTSDCKCDYVRGLVLNADGTLRVGYGDSEVLKYC